MASGREDWVQDVFSIGSGIDKITNTANTDVTKGRNSTGTIHTVATGKTLFITDILMTASLAERVSSGGDRGTSIVTLEIDGVEVFRLVASAAHTNSAPDTLSALTSGNQNLSKAFSVPIRVAAGVLITTTITRSASFIGGESIMIHGWEE